MESIHVECTIKAMYEEAICTLRVEGKGLRRSSKGP